MRRAAAASTTGQVRDALACTRYLRRAPQLRRLAPLLPSAPVFLTGGSVRDALLGLPLTDIDLAVVGDAAPLAKVLAEKLHGKAFPLGKEPLVTYRVVSSSLSLDLWPVTGSLEEDVLRRDFTVNAVFFRLPGGPLLDLVGGVEDAAAGRLVAIREENFLADPLRVLRGLRLALTRPLRLTQATAAMLRRTAPGLRTVARERIREELVKMTAQAPWSRAFAGGVHLGVWEALGVTPSEPFPDPQPSLNRLDMLRHKGPIWRQVCRAVGWAALALPRLLLGEPPKEAVVAALEPVGFAGKELSRLARIIAGAEALLTCRDPKELLAPLFPQRETLAWFFVRKHEIPWRQLLTLWRWWQAFAKRPPLLPSEEVLALAGLAPGPQRFQVLAELRRLQATGTLRSPAAARRFLHQRQKPHG